MPHARGANVPPSTSFQIAPIELVCFLFLIRGKIETLILLRSLASCFTKILLLRDHYALDSAPQFICVQSFSSRSFFLTPLGCVYFGSGFLHWFWNFEKLSLVSFCKVPNTTYASYNPTYSLLQTSALRHHLQTSPWGCTFSNPRLATDFYVVVYYQYQMTKIEINHRTSFSV